MKLDQLSYARRKLADQQIKLFEEEIILKNQAYQPMDFNLAKMVQIKKKNFICKISYIYLKRMMNGSLIKTKLKL